MSTETNDRDSRARFRTPDDPRSPRRVQVNLPLRFGHEVLGLEHLHYGLWDDGDELDFAGLERAQERYTEMLFDWIPEGTKTVLDVGCGTGATARKLHDRGFAVEGLSPDPYQEKLFRERLDRPFHLGRFQEFEPDAAYDLVLMSESAQYVWLDSLFPAVRRAAPGGHLLVADYFTALSDGGELARSGHPLDAFLAKAEEARLELLRREDVTERGLATLELANRWLERYVEPTAAMLAEHAAAKSPLLYRLGHWLTRRWRERKLVEARREIDPEHFRRVKRYLFLLFRVLPGAG